MKLSPKSEALAYRIWAYCEPRGWNVTVKELAEELGTSRLRVTGLLGLKGWGGRIRVDHTARIGWEDMPQRYDEVDMLADTLRGREHLSDLATINA